MSETEIKAMSDKSVSIIRKTIKYYFLFYWIKKISAVAVFVGEIWYD